MSRREQRLELAMAAHRGQIDSIEQPMQLLHRQLHHVRAAALLGGNLKAVDALLNKNPVATCEPLRRVAARAIELGRYPF